MQKDSGLKRFIRAVRESSHIASSKGGEWMEGLLHKAGWKSCTPKQAKWALGGAVTLGGAATLAMAPFQALGIAGFGLSFISPYFRDNFHARTVQAGVAGLFAAQYALNLPAALSGLIMAGIATVRPTVLTMIPDENTNQRKMAAGAFWLVGVSSIVGSSILMGGEAGLSMGEKMMSMAPAVPMTFGTIAQLQTSINSRYARLMNICGTACVMAYDGLVSGNAGSFLANTKGHVGLQYAVWRYDFPKYGLKNTGKISLKERFSLYTDSVRHNVPLKGITPQEIYDALDEKKPDELKNARETILRLLPSFQSVELDHKSMHRPHSTALNKKPENFQTPAP